MSALHITNGDIVAERIRASRVEGDVLPWRDVLHEGPVPARLSLEELSRVRARFLSDGPHGHPFERVLQELSERDRALKSFRRHERVVLWFEHDLYDQLQLIQILHWFALRAPVEPRLELICIGEYPGLEPFHGLGQLTAEQLGGLEERRSAVTAAQLEAGRRAWEAFTADSPEKLTSLTQEALSTMPFLRPALARLFEEYPSTREGLARSERQILETIESGEAVLGAVFRVSQIECERAPFMGNWPFLLRLEALRAGDQPLLAFEDGGEVAAAGSGAHGEELWKRRLHVTEAGRSVVEGRADRSRFQSVERWLGGVQLTGPTPAWRWSPGTRKVVAQER